MEFNNIFEEIDDKDKIEKNSSHQSFKSALPLKVFVPPKEETTSATTTKAKFDIFSSSSIKNSYIDIVGDEGFKSQNCKADIDRNVDEKEDKKKLSLAPNLNVNCVMKAVETNNVSKVSEFLAVDKKYVLTLKDQFGWTAMMCACCAGSKDVIKLLLKYKPNLNVTDKTGNTCLKIAQSKGQKEIVTLLNQYLKSLSNNIDESTPINKSLESIDKPTSFYCETCKQSVKEPGGVHLTSTVHLFNSNRKSGVPTSYGIPESNVGFQMLLKTGWDREKGLGPEGSGQKFPPKTMLKQDRAGLGAKKYTSKITHDPHLSVKDRTERQKTVNKREKLREELKNKRKERDLRRSLDL